MKGPSFRRLLHEAASGVTEGTSRSALAVLGTALGIGSFIAVLGVTSSANGQISRDFDSAAASRVSVQAVSQDGEINAASLPKDAESRVSVLNGVEAVGRWWDVTVERASTVPPPFDDDTTQTRTVAVSPEYWSLAEPVLASGRVFDQFLTNQPVAVIGQRIAEELNLAGLGTSPVIFLDGHAVTVIGIVSASAEPAPLSSIVIPSGYATTTFGDPGGRASLIVQCATGASKVVASQVSVALDPFHPDNFRVVPPPSPTVVRDQVGGSLQVLFLALALICLFVGAVGITNAALVGVLARTSEIGLRRALGAMPRHIAEQFLIEAAVRGLIGGALGACAGLVTVTVVALAQHWTAIIEPWTVVGAPVAGALVGTLAGLYPAIRASRIEPVEAFRR